MIKLKVLFLSLCYCSFALASASKTDTDAKIESLEVNDQEQVAKTLALVEQIFPLVKKQTTELICKGFRSTTLDKSQSITIDAAAARKPLKEQYQEFIDETLQSAGEIYDSSLTTILELYQKLNLADQKTIAIAKLSLNEIKKTYLIELRKSLPSFEKTMQDLKIIVFELPSLKSKLSKLGIASEDASDILSIEALSSIFEELGIGIKHITFNFS